MAFSSLEMQRGPIYPEKKTLTNLQKKKLQKRFFRVCVIGTTWFDECFSFHIMTGRH